MYKHPGVYIEHVPSGLLSIEAASTSVAAFIGPVKRGELVTADKETDGKPVFISSQAQFAKYFGELDGSAGGLRNQGSTPDYFGHSVQSFFANGGTKAYIVPIGDGNGSESSAAFVDPNNASMGFYFTARSAGVWADGLTVLIEQAVSDANPLLTTYDVTIGVPDGSGGFDPVLESFSDMTLDPTSGQFLASSIDNASELVSVAHATVASAGGGAIIGALSSDLSALDPTTIANGDTINLDFSGDTVAGNPITVTFNGTATTLAELAAEIQTQARGAATVAARAGFVAAVTRDKKILLLPGKSASPATTNEVEVSGGSVQTDLGFDAATVVNYPQAWSVLTTPLSISLAGGVDHGAPANADYTNALIHLRDYRDVSILLLPGKHWISGGDNAALEQAITHSEFMQNRMVLIDPPDPVGSARLQSPADIKALGAPTSPYTALYYPWMEVANPFYDPDTAANLPKTFRVPAGSFAAGLWARTDGKRGVWKAPAGLEASVRGAVGPTLDIGADLQDNLNEFGVNCLRSIVGPTVIWGARTRATKTKPEFRYVSVRRTQSMIGESLYGALQAVVFEPNNHKLWSALRANVTAFMDTLYRAGAFQGEKASDAYYVQCGLGSTMTQADIDAGIVRVVVGFAALKPAEFVVVQIKQIVGKAA
ncbi:phage tail sheath C-terminal domain-containing protein [Reinekea sp. G2M2-21]|uniref:phage tail sheath C-terminal domain-containing protein n=1 Tax=Reinekea sp. G2M2-21 TaxID=2788942 RepID=UPI0018AB4C23|nr:phage tail sheath C-terminal domain-containing protein [Reinekea sp. G2M2-21]